MKHGIRSLKWCAYPWFKRSFSKFSHTHFYLIANWQDIIGKELSERTKLSRVSFPPGKRREGRLFIEASSAHISTLNYCIQALLDKVNAFYGYPAFKSVSFLQCPFQIPKKESLPPPLDIDIADERLKIALEKLAVTLKMNTP